MRDASEIDLGDLHAWEIGSQAKAGVGRWITFYNHRRPHAARGRQPPPIVCFSTIETDQQQLGSPGNLSKDRGVAHLVVIRLSALDGSVALIKS
jgi:hypothetical protein